MGPQATREPVHTHCCWGYFSWNSKVTSHLFSLSLIHMKFVSALSLSLHMSLFLYVSTFSYLIITHMLCYYLCTYIFAGIGTLNNTSSKNALPNDFTRYRIPSFIVVFHSVCVNSLYSSVAILALRFPIGLLDPYLEFVAEVHYS